MPQRNLDCNATIQDVTYTVVTPEVAFTGDTAAEVFSSPGFEDALAAKLLIIEATFLEEDILPQHAKVSTLCQKEQLEQELHSSHFGSAPVGM